MLCQPTMAMMTWNWKLSRFFPSLRRRELIFMLDGDGKCLRSSDREKLSPEKIVITSQAEWFKASPFPSSFSVKAEKGKKETSTSWKSINRSAPQERDSAGKGSWTWNKIEIQYAASQSIWHVKCDFARTPFGACLLNWVLAQWDLLRRMKEQGNVFISTIGAVDLQRLQKFFFCSAIETFYVHCTASLCSRYIQWMLIAISFSWHRLTYFNVLFPSEGEVRKHHREARNNGRNFKAILQRKKPK